ncbi:MAG: hypothetical protein ABGX47_08280 [Martelella sp.]
MITALLSLLATPVAPGIWLGPQLLVLGGMIWAVSAQAKRAINHQNRSK